MDHETELGLVEMGGLVNEAVRGAPALVSSRECTSRRFTVSRRHDRPSTPTNARIQEESARPPHSKTHPHTCTACLSSTSKYDRHPMARTSTATTRLGGTIGIRRHHPVCRASPRHASGSGRRTPEGVRCVLQSKQRAHRELEAGVGCTLPVHGVPDRCVDLIVGLCVADQSQKFLPGRTG